MAAPISVKIIFPLLFHRLKRAFKGGNQVGGVFRTNGKPDRVWFNSLIQELLSGELGMCRAGRVDYQGFDIGNIRKQ